MNCLPSLLRRELLAAVIVIFSFASMKSQADNGTWNLSTGGAWATPGNWVASTVASGSGFTANFNSVNLAGDATVTLPTGTTTIGNLIFGNATPGNNYGWILSGNTLALAGTTPTVTVNNLGTGRVTISSTFTASAGLTKAGSGTLSFSSITAPTIHVKEGTLLLTGTNFNSAYTVDSGATLNLNGSAMNTNNERALSGAGIVITSASNNDVKFNSGTFSGNIQQGQLVKTGPADGLTLTLSGTNSYTGGTYVYKGTLLISGSGSINSTSSISVSPIGATVSIFRYDSSVALTRNVTVSSGGRFFYNSSVKYTGTLTLSSGGTLGGTGALGNVTLASGRTLAPGQTGDGSTGALTVDSLTLQAGANSYFDIQSEIQFDSIHSAGNKVLNGALTLTFASLLPEGGDFALFSGAGTLSGNFASIHAAGAYSGTFSLVGGFYQLESAGQTLVFNHQTGVLSVEAIPEPSSFLLLAGGLMVLLFRFRRRA